MLPFVVNKDYQILQLSGYNSPYESCPAATECNVSRLVGPPGMLMLLLRSGLATSPAQGCSNPGLGQDIGTCNPKPVSSVAAGAWGHVPPTPVWSGHGNCRNPRRKKWRWVGVPDHLGQTNYAEICILVTKYKIHLKTE